MWLSLVVLLAAPALLSPLALFPMPHGFPLSLLGALSLFLKICSYAILWAALSALTAAAATFKGRLEARVLAVIWFVALFAGVVAFSTAGRLAAH